MKLSFKEFLDVIEAATTTAQTSAPQSSGGGGYSQRLFGGYESSPVLVDKDEFVGKDADKQAKDCGLAMCLHQLGVGRTMTDRRTTNKRLRNQKNDLPINNSNSKK